MCGDTGVTWSAQRPRPSLAHCARSDAAPPFPAARRVSPLLPRAHDAVAMDERQGGPSVIDALPLQQERARLRASPSVDAQASVGFAHGQSSVVLVWSVSPVSLQILPKLFATSFAFARDRQESPVGRCEADGAAVVSRRHRNSGPICRWESMACAKHLGASFLPVIAGSEDGFDLVDHVLSFLRPFSALSSEPCHLVDDSLSGR